MKKKDYKKEIELLQLKVKALEFELELARKIPAPYYYPPQPLYPDSPYKITCVGSNSQNINWSTLRNLQIV